MSESERPGLKPDDLAPKGYVRIRGVGLVHVGVLIGGAGLAAFLAWKALK